MGLGDTCNVPCIALIVEYMFFFEESKDTKTYRGGTTHLVPWYAESVDSKVLNDCET